jgi:hypothetical protein
MAIVIVVTVRSGHLPWWAKKIPLIAGQRPHIDQR